MPGPVWEPWEDAVVLGHDGTDGQLQAKLPRRSYYSIKWRKSALGSTARRTPPWTGKDLKRLRAEYQSGGIVAAIAAFPQRSKAAIKWQVKTHKMRSLSRHLNPVPRNCPQLVVDIRDELSRRGMSITECANRLGFPKNALCPGTISRNGPSHAALDQIVRSLGGELYVEWED